MTQEPEQGVQTRSTSKANRFWLIVLGIGMVGVYAALFVPALGGLDIEPKLGISFTLGHVLFFRLWWKQKGRKGWHGALLGLFVGFLMFFLAAFLSGIIKHP